MVRLSSMQQPAMPPPRARPQSQAVAAVALVALLGSSCKATCGPQRSQPARSRQAPRAANRSCEDDSWVSYGHDARRTSASPACCTGPLREAWRFTPAPKGGRPAKPNHAIAAADAVFVAAVIGDAPALIRLTRDGEPVWVFDSRVDISQAHWPLLAHDHVVLNDVGLYIVDRSSGSRLFDRGLDSWGQVVADASRLYMVNERHVDGPLVRVGAFDSTGQLIWQQNVAGAVRDDVRDAVGAIALDEGTLYQAADYRYTGLTGLFAFDATTGNARWTAIAHPAGGVSAGRGSLYLVERSRKGAPALLTARTQASGDVRWSSPVRGHDGAAPALVANLVLTFNPEASVDAWDADSGQPVWTHSFPPSAGPQVPNSTHVAAALGSSTIVVTAGNTLAVLSAKDGRELWSEDLANRGLGPVHSPIIANGRVYVVGDKEVVALDCAPDAL